MTRHDSSLHRRDAARRPAELLHEVRQAKIDARDFALFCSVRPLTLG